VPALDGVRGIAILSVLLVHLRWQLKDTVVDRIVTAFADCGWMGVDLFFVLSGFLITGILIDWKSSPHHFRSFYGRRALRILPLYYAFVAFFVLVLPIGHARTPQMNTLLAHQGWLWAHATNIWAALDGLGAIPYNIGIAWSLAVEEQFYLVWPFLVQRTTSSALLRVCAGCIIAAFVLRLAIAGHWPSAAYTLMPARMDAFAMGAILAVLYRRPGGLQLLKPLALPIGGLAFAAIMVMYSLRGNKWGTDLGVETIGIAFADWLAASVLVIALTRDTTFFASPFLRFFGRYSYAIYLFHLPVATVLIPSRRG
jgi:peptidoglycan/LPS O-acetylase OafA/YrhL